MGQFGNQPDFGTQAIALNPSGDAFDGLNRQSIDPPCALYVGTGGDLLVTVVGSDETSGLNNAATLFMNVPSGTFMPIIVSYIWSDYDGSLLTTASNIVGLR